MPACAKIKPVVPSVTDPQNEAKEFRSFCSPWICSRYDEKVFLCEKLCKMEQLLFGTLDFSCDMATPPPYQRLSFIYYFFVEFGGRGRRAALNHSHLGRRPWQISIIGYLLELMHADIIWLSSVPSLFKGEKNPVRFGKHLIGWNNNSIWIIIFLRFL